MSNTIWIIVCAVGIPAGLYACWRQITRSDKVDNPATRAAPHLHGFARAVKDIDKKP